GVPGLAGDPLPWTPRFSGNISADLKIPLTAELVGFVGASESYVGDRTSSFDVFIPGTTVRRTYPSYTQTDLRAGANYGAWTFNLFVNNVTDHRGVIGNGY